MLEFSNRPRSIKVTMRGADGVLQHVAQIRKDTFEFQGDVSDTIKTADRAELTAVVDALRQNQKLYKDAVLTRLIDTLAEAMQRYAESTDEMERRLIRQFIENAFRHVRKPGPKA
jgi:hypothetical protein